MAKKIKKRTVYQAMKSFVETTLNEIPTELLAIGADSSVDEDTGEVSAFVQIEAEVPRGNGALSRCRFIVKIPNGNLKLTEIQLEDSEYSVKFIGLVISYIDVKGNVYFRAEDYDVKAMN